MAGFKGDSDARSSPRILIIDDNATVRRVLRERLTSPPLSGTVTEADDGSVGLRLALEQEFDCVLCDVSMSRIDGIAFLRMIRAQRSPLDLPVVLMTAHDAVAQRVSGFRCGASDFVSKPFEMAELVARVQTQVTVARMNRELTRMAHFDPLTGACNRRRFMDEFQRELARARRLRRRLAMALLDIDFFKRINDAHGHPAGDAVLVGLVALLDGQRRAYDTLGRVGGEEFAMLLPEVPPLDALRVAERWRAAVEGSAIGGLPAGAVTVSIGLAEGPLGEGDSADSIYKRADDKLYEAKHGGRNRVCANRAELPTDPPAP
jgi:diguanylate cyclase (GGDEF)-like protein